MSPGRRQHQAAALLIAEVGGGAVPGRHPETIPLPAQTIELCKVLLLRAVLNVRTSHFMRTLPFGRRTLELRTHTAQLAVWHGTVRVLPLPADVARVAE